MPSFKTATLAAACFALSCGAAAAQAVTATDLNMRAGPGTNYSVVEVIPQGTPVDVMNCGGNWCEVSFGGTTGFASIGYLDMGPGAGPGMGAAMGPAMGPDPMTGEFIGGSAVPVPYGDIEDEENELDALR